MPSSNTAVIVFVLDSSRSMQLCIEGVKEHIRNFAGVFSTDANQSWDIRLEFIAHKLMVFPDGEWKLKLKTIRERKLKSIYGNGRFFTQSVEEFFSALAGVNPSGYESSLPVIDCALDLPWREHATFRRVVIVMTDEKLETGAFAETSFPADIICSMSKIVDLISKINSLKVMLFLVTPDSAGYEKLASANKAVRVPIDEGGGLAGIDFGEILASMAKSITKSQSPPGGTRNHSRRFRTRNMALRASRKKSKLTYDNKKLC